MGTVIGEKWGIIFQRAGDCNRPMKIAIFQPIDNALLKNGDLSFRWTPFFSPRKMVLWRLKLKVVL